jgi:hypothetical protein
MNMPSGLATNWSRLALEPPRLGVPFGLSGAIAGVNRLATLLTSGRRAILYVKAAEYDEGASPVLPTATVNCEGSVLARNVGYEDWVRRAAAIEAIATPPSNMTRTATLR